MVNQIADMKDLIKRKNQFSLVVGLFLGMQFLGVIFSFLASNFVENLNGEQAKKFFFVPVYALFIATIFFLIIFFMEYSKYKLEDVPSWWVIFYLTFFVPRLNYILPLVLLLIFLAKEFSVKNKLIICALNFAPLICTKIVSCVFLLIEESQLTDEDLFIEFYMFIKTAIRFISVILIANKIVSVEQQKNPNKKKSEAAGEKEHESFKAESKEKAAEKMNEKTDKENEEDPYDLANIITKKKKSMSSEENHKFIIVKNSNYEKYGIEPEIFINLVKEFFDAVEKNAQQNDDTDSLAKNCTKSLFEKTDFYLLNKINIFENTCYLKLEMNSPCKIKITSEHVSENGYDFAATLMKKENKWLFSEMEIKPGMKYVKFYDVDRSRGSFEIFIYHDGRIGSSYLSQNLYNTIWDFVDDDYRSTTYNNSDQEFSDKLILKFFENEKVYPDIENDMYATHHFHYFFTDAQLKKLVRFYEGSYLAYTLNERKFFVDLKSRNRNPK